MTKIALLETQMKDMTTQNQTLWSQVCNQNEPENPFKPLVARQEKSELTPEQLPMTFGEFAIPPLNLNAKPQLSQTMPLLVKAPSINSFLNFGEEATESTATEVSQGSPSIQQSMESDKCFDMPDTIQTFYLPQVSVARPSNGLMVSRQEMSMGHLFEAWNSENQNVEMSYSAAPQDASVLGKRQLDLNNQTEDRFVEPTLKRHELSIFSNKKYMISAGAEEREMFKMMLNRETSIGGDFDLNMGIDLMDYTNPFCEWTKTA